MEAAAGALLLAWMVQAAAATLLCGWTLRLLDRPQPWPREAPPVLVLAPVRGPLPGLDRFLAALAAQDYPAWRVALVVEAEADPAFPALARFAAAHPDRAAVVVAGPATRRGQKVQNLLAGLGHLRAGDAALVMLDADTAPPPDLLRRLLRPVLTGQGDIASGYRWTLPADGAAGSALVALADMPSPPCRAAPGATSAGAAPRRSAAPRWGGWTCPGSGTPPCPTT
jgi:ceramide glucosyltransferase